MSLLTDLKNGNKVCGDTFKKPPEGLLAHKSYSVLEWGTGCFLQKNSGTSFCRMQHTENMLVSQLNEIFSGVV
jgi:hypothetical protein